MDMATKTDTIATEQQGLAGQQMQRANETEQAGQQSEIGDFVGAALKGAAAVASLAIGGPAAGAAVIMGLDGLPAIH